MRIKSYGLFFDFLPTKETMNEKMEVVKDYVTQECTNFAMASYYKGEKKNVAFNEDGFQSYTKQMFIELFMLDTTNPRKMLYDKKDDSFYRILETPINQEYNPSKRKIYRLTIEMINDSDLRFDSQFIRDKFKEMEREINGNL